MTTFKILSIEETNEFLDTRKAFNGGGYSQPLVTFEFRGQEGFFENSSCGEFGSRFMLSCMGFTKIWGSMLEDFEEFSSFPKHIEDELLTLIFKALKEVA